MKRAIFSVHTISALVLGIVACGDDDSSVVADGGSDAAAAPAPSMRGVRMQPATADVAKSEPPPVKEDPPATGGKRSPPVAQDASMARADAQAAEEDAGPPEEDDAGVAEPVRTPLIRFNPMYTAFDGVHDYQLTPSVPRAAADASDPVDPRTVKWILDSEYFIRDPFPDLTASMKLTTKRAGSTRVRVEATTLAGERVYDEAEVLITEVSAEEWETGNARFQVGSPITWAPRCTAPEELGLCRLPCSTLQELPTTSACASCHGAMSTSRFAIEYTPTQTGGQSNDQLAETFLAGGRANFTMFDTEELREAEDPRCVFYIFHTWEMNDAETRGVIAQLRAIPPAANEAIDSTR